MFKSTSIVEIGKYAFGRCTSLNELDFSETQKIGDYAFSRSGITKANFAMLNEIGNKAFFKCSSLTSIC